MAPLRPITDLCLIAVFKQFTPNDQLKASQMSPRCSRLVRAANHRLHTLTITDSDNVGELNSTQKFYSLSSKPSMQLLTEEYRNDPLLNFPVIPFNKWNCLQLHSIVNSTCSKLTASTVRQIVHIFAGVTRLSLITQYLHYTDYSQLLQQPVWRGQLSTLAVVDIMISFNDRLAGRLCTAINRLTALRYLSINWNMMSPSSSPSPSFKMTERQVPELPIFGQLKAVAIINVLGSMKPFLSCLQQYAPDNAALQVHLLAGSPDTASHLDHLNSSEQKLSAAVGLSRQLVRYQCSSPLLDFTRDRVPQLCAHFTGLTSLEVDKVVPDQVEALFAALAQLPRLLHLKFGVSFWGYEEDGQLPALPQQQPCSTTVRALDLCLAITAHEQVQWLGLQGRLPQLQAIHLEEFSCSVCGLHLTRYSIGRYLEAVDCFRASLLPDRLHAGVPQRRIVLDASKHNRDQVISIEQVLLLRDFQQ